MSYNASWCLEKKVERSREKAKGLSDTNSYQAQLTNALEAIISFEQKAQESQKEMSKMHELHALQSQMIENDHMWGAPVE